MAYDAFSDRNVGHEATGANIFFPVSLVLGRQQNREAGLGESAPVVFEEIVFKQHALSILKFKEILHNKRAAISATNESGLPLHPGDGLKQVVMANFDITRVSGGLATSQEDAFAGSFEEVVDDLEWAHGVFAEPASDGLGVYTRSRFRHTVEVGKIRIDHCHVAEMAEHDASHGLVMRSSVNPHAVEDNVISGSFGAADQVVDGRRRRRARDLQAD